MSIAKTSFGSLTQPTDASTREESHDRVIGLWLLFCAACVFVMVIVGGITRLTQSGLSMVEWEPIMGVIPPLTEAAWLEVFAKYKESPEYLKINFGMTLSEFKFIFYWEYGHRVLGRLIGLIYLLPLLFFLAKGWVTKKWRTRFFLLFLLGGAQGVMGWYMVMSGLVDVPHVSQYRLTAHLGLAIVIFSIMLWFAMDFLRAGKVQQQASSTFLMLSQITPFVIFMMILSGGFVAGTKAGFILNTFPDMGGEYLPSGLMALEPAWRNLFENPVAIQFIHRCLAGLVTLLVLATFFLARRQSFETATVWLLIAVLMQVSLGIFALLYRVPVELGAAHQGGAVVLLATSLWVAHRARKGG